MPCRWPNADFTGALAINTQFTTPQSGPIIRQNCLANNRLVGSSATKRVQSGAIASNVFPINTRFFIIVLFRRTFS